MSGMAVTTASDVAALAWVRRACRAGEACRIREAAGVTLAEVARVCRVTAAAVSYWERGQRVPSGAPALAYARLLQRLEKEAA